MLEKEYMEVLCVLGNGHMDTLCVLGNENMEVLCVGEWTYGGTVCVL